MSEEHDETNDYNLDDVPDEDDDKVVIELSPDFSFSIDYFKLLKFSNLIRDQYPKNEINLLSDDLQQYQQKYSLKSENIISFFDCFNGKVQLNRDNYLDFLKLSKIFKVPKIDCILRHYANEHLRDPDFLIKKLKWHMMIQKDDLDEVEPEITNLLKERVHDCLQNPEFGDLPIEKIYKIISNSSEPVENDLLYDFIKKSLDTRYVLFTFLNIENLSAQRFNDLAMLFSNCDDQSLRKYKPHIQYDLLNLKSKKDKIDSLTIVLSTMMPILCKVPPDVLIPILPRDL